MKVLSAFRAKRDFCSIKEGEVFNLSLFSDICDLDTSISRKVLYELYCAALGEETAFDLNYVDAPAESGRSSYAKADGVIWLDMMKSDSPQLIINGPITRKSARWCASLTEAVNKNDRLGMSFLFSKKLHEVDCIVMFVNEPTVGCIKNIPFERCAQVISATTNTDRYKWATGHYIVPSLHAVVARGFIARLRDVSKIGRSLSGRLTGYVAKLNITGTDPTHKSFSDYGSWDFYAGGEGYWVTHPGSAFIYSSEKEALKAAEGTKPKLINSTHSWGWFRELAGAEVKAFRINNAQDISISVIPTSSWRNEMFGVSDGINYYAEACKEEK